ncbi:MAG: COG1615 family transporter, partial [bacterium]|nr:COG1615 family transporter [bacterium]
PNEWDYEKDYIARNIEFTRIAYGLDEVKAQAWPGDGALTAETLAAHAGTTDNLQVWDPAPLQSMFNQKQRIRSYYAFNGVDVDRYEVDGALRPVMIAPRELGVDGLPEKNRVWTNLHLYYTHGYGLCMSFANRAVAGGLPDFLIRDIPPVSTRAPEVAEPRIYFGENTTGYALVDTDLDEFDYPGDPENFFNRYAGTGGLSVGGTLRRALLAWHTGDKDILFTEQFRDESRILLFRQVRARVAKLAPFLFFDEDPYPVLHEGRIVWILDGYTITRRFPYSEALGIANYWRNSVKATVDAYDGSVTFYRADAEDPILRVFERVFPALVRSIDDMPAGLRAHVRYPKDMFRVQTAVYHKYHVDDARVFYNGEDVWTFPRVTDGERTSYEDPRYPVMELPGAGTPEEFLLVRTFTVEGKDNMIAWLAGRCDGPNYGELHLYRLPKKRNTYGPNQAKGRFNQDPDVSEFNTLMGQRGSAVIQSNVSAVPIADGLIYLQSLFIEDPEVKIPELKQIVVGHGDRVAMRPTLEQALAALFDDVPPAEAVPALAQPGDDPNQRARDLYRQAQERMKSGDWTGFGEAFDALGEALKAGE